MTQTADRRNQGLAKWRLVLRMLAGLLLAAVCVFLLLAYWPLSRPPLTYTPLPRMSFAETVSRVNDLIRHAPPELQPQCKGEMLQHGHPTERVFVLMHGLSNCPAQFHAFGELLYRRGYNVVLPRLPFHGEKDRMTDDWKDLSAQMLLESANQAIDVARALGRRITVVGLSVNGTTAAWVAQHRSDVDEVVLLAPFLASKTLPEWAVAPAARLILRLPNRFYWWDPVKKGSGGNGYSYPRFPSHAIGQVLDLSQEVLRDAGRGPARCGAILVVTTASDQTASLPVTRSLVRAWQQRRPDAVRTYEFPAEQHVDHDFIDPKSPMQQVDRVYPKLLSLLLAGEDDGR